MPWYMSLTLFQIRIKLIHLYLEYLCILKTHLNSISYLENETDFKQKENILLSVYKPNDL